MLTGKKASFCIITIDKKLRVSLIIYLYKICENTNMMKKRFAIVAAIALGASRMVGFPMMLEDLKVSCSQWSREFSYSDKYGGFYYGMTGIDDWKEWNAGWNIFAKRIFNDYRIAVDDKELKRKKAKVEVYPDRVERTYQGGVKEIFSLVDNKKVIFIDVEVNPEELKDGVSIELLGDIISAPKAEGKEAICVPQSYPDCVVRIAAMHVGDVKVEGRKIVADAASGGFIIAFGSADESAALVADARRNKTQWLAERATRMQKILNDNANDCGYRVAKSLAWIMLTADELVTWQHGGWGIYAGLPWFTDFWGRDMFISMPGIVLCTGQFDVAKNILLSFAKHMDMNPQSPTYGRVPNRLNLDGVLYNTTDGTPRFVLQVLDYVRYTGDGNLIKTIYKNVKIATDASLNSYVDEKGYLTHADADTWMDAKRQGKYPCSPRGNRAVDIQALWYGQLIAASQMADYVGKSADARRWRTAAEKLKANFEKDFIADGVIADHLNSDGTRDRQLRPNTMYAYELIDSENVKINDIRTTWSRLVYPWGVGSLDQMDDDFHPYHEQWYRYHKDDAYHNGTVWLWQNGMAMQRMIEFGERNKAFELFEYMAKQAMEQGAVGSLSECADAWCRPGKTWARRTGTFLQAWSNAEQIRVWSQCFLGVKPDMLNRAIDIAPRVPLKIMDFSTQVCLGEGSLQYGYKKRGDKIVYNFIWRGKQPVNLNIDLAKFKNFTIAIGKGASVEIAVDCDSAEAMVTDAEGVKSERFTVEIDPAKVAFAKKCKEKLKDVRFAKPCYREDLKSMLRYFNPPLHYGSVE